MILSDLVLAVMRTAKEPVFSNEVAEALGVSTGKVAYQLSKLLG